MDNKKIRDLNPYRYKCVAIGGKDRYIEFKNLLLNNLGVLRKSTGKPIDYPTEAFIKDNLIEDSKIGFVKSMMLPTRISDFKRKNKLGNPTRAILQYGNGKREEVSISYDDKGEYYVINAFTDTYSFASLIKDALAEIELYHSAKIQNIQACKTPYIVTCKDPKTRLSLIHAVEEKESGQPTIIVDKDVGEGLTSTKTGVEFLADKYDELEQKAIDKLLNKLGIMSANINKKERVQVGEVNATLGQCLDYIYALIDNFNKQCETYGIDLIMVDNTSLNEYEKESETDKPVKEGNDNE